MGCDITMFVEIYKNCAWVSEEYYKKDSNGEFIEVPIYSGRNYELFSNLADVRNNMDNEVIASPRGLPTNVSKKVLDEYRKWEDDSHSSSYFTLLELEYFLKNKKPSRYGGFMNLANSKLVDSDLTPENYIQNKTKDKHIYKEWDSVDCNGLSTIISKLKDRLDDNYMWELTDKNNIRIVFWFDS